MRTAIQYAFALTPIVGILGLPVWFRMYEERRKRLAAPSKGRGER